VSPHRLRIRPVTLSSHVPVLFADGFLGFLLIGLWVFCIFDVITTPEHLVKHLPKVM
jgi:hypothetical protein